MDNPSKRKLDPPTAPEPPNPEQENTDKRRKVIGPALPPPTSNNNSDQDSDNDSGSDSDDDFGPSLPPPEGSVPQQAQAQANVQTQAQSSHQATNTSQETESKATPKRDAWMLAPPTSDSDRSRVDPTKIRNRKFQSGPRVGNAPSGGGGVDSAWTETPEEKMRRLQDEAMGVRASARAGGGPGPGPEASVEDEKAAQAMREKVARYNRRVRGDEGSLVEEKKRKDKDRSGTEEDDDPSKRAFDKEKDMALSSKLTHAQRKEMMNKASDFGSRFSKGKFL